jgi:drug/metabolite transporter (DMT)-like permease
MAVLLALVAAAVYGSADFGGGLASRRAPAVQVALVGQVCGMLVLVPAIVLSGGVETQSLLWGTGAGFFGGLAILAFYRALAGGTMSVVAPVSAVTAVGLPVLFALVTGERPGALQAVGIAVALVAIVLVSQERPDAPAPVGEGPTPHLLSPAAGEHAAAHVDEAGEEDTARLPFRTALLLSLLAGCLFAPLYIFFDQADAGAVPWALVGARLASIPTLFLIAVATRVPLRPERPVLPIILVSGFFDMLANVFIVLAFDHGPLTVVAVISSLYPVMTVVLARVLLGEHLERLQQAGMGAALVAIVLISAG